MALVKCKECFHSISKTATQCPNCGAKIRHTTLITKIIASLLVFWVLSIIFGEDTTNVKNEIQAEASSQIDDSSIKNNSNQESSQEGKYLIVPSDRNAKFYVLDKAKDGNDSVIITKRIGSSGITYSSRLYDCQKNTVKYLGTGETRSQMEQSKPDDKMSPVTVGSIAYYVGLEACVK